MNQILDYNPDNKGKRKSSGSDNIVRFFAIIIIIFALVMAGNGLYGLYKRSQESSEASASTTEGAQIEVTQQESQAVIKVTHTKSIEKIVYSWNNGKETTIKLDGSTTSEQVVSLPAGENTLNVKVTDVDGVESTYSGVFTSDSGEDIINPVISLDVDQETKKLIITATDEESLDFITYRWNDDEEIKVEASDEDRTQIVVEVEILKGKNDITVVAVDSNNNTTTETMNYTGVTKPEVTITVSSDKNSIDVSISHENGLSDVSISINGSAQTLDIEEGLTELNFTVNLPEGENDIIVTAKSVDGTVTEATETVNATTTIEPTNDDSLNTDVEEPEITFERSEDGEQVTVKMSQSSGINSIKLNINDVDYNVNISEVATYFEMPITLVDGNNKITVTVTAEDGAEKTEVQEISK